MGYIDTVAERSVYRAYLEALNETDDQSLEHLKNCIHESIVTDLSVTQRKYLVMYLAGYNCVEIAKICGVCKSTSARTISRALDILFEHIRYATPRTLKATKEARKRLTNLYK